jgi:membrane-bound lytic murein transglycosylase A
MDRVGVRSRHEWTRQRATPRALAGGALVVWLAAGCIGRPAPPPPAAVAASTALAPTDGTPALLDDGDHESLRAAIRQSLDWLETQPPERPLTFGPRPVSAAAQGRALTRLLADLVDDPPAPVLAARVLRHFEPLRSVGAGDSRVLVTGYYEPVVKAVTEADPAYPVPILGVPDDLIEGALEAFDPRLGAERIFGRIEGRRLVPYWTRAEIEDGRLGRHPPVLAWARDPVDVFFMEVQGSGTLRLPDGGEIRVGYAASNGRAYRSIGRLLIDEGKLGREAVSLQTIRAWLAAHPEERARVLRHNEAYVFFRRLDGPPLGSLGVPVTPGRSIATDPRLFPPGALAFLRTDRPRATPDGLLAWLPLRRFVLNQDTGGAIRGAGRVDVFWGRGADAELAAGLMKQPGDLYFLAPRP